MKKFLLAFAAILFLLPSAAFSQREVVRLTRYGGDRITGVYAASSFQVELVKSNDTKAVVEIDGALEPYLRFSRGSDGVVSVGIRSLNNREQREYERLVRQQVNRTMKLTLYLPEVNSIRLSGACKLTTSDIFTGNNIHVQLSGSSRMQGLNISGASLKVDCSGASNASLTARVSGDLTATASGSAKIDLQASGVANSKLTASGASNVQIKGDGRQGNWTTSGSARIVGDEFPLQQLTVTASGASSVRTSVSESLTSRTSGSSSVRYRGQPTHLNNNTSGSSSVRSL